MKELVAKDPEEIVDCLRAFGEQTWLEIMEKIGNPNPNWLNFHLHKLKDQGRISARYIGDIGVYKILNNSDNNINTLSTEEDSLTKIVLQLLHFNHELIQIIHQDNQNTRQLLFELMHKKLNT